MHALFGGKSPHPQSIVVGGVTCVQDIPHGVQWWNNDFGDCNPKKCPYSFIWSCRGR
ncbi:MAG TPA: hypothetical protein EYP60_05315, partial [bacterium (Candidatus Stahlbacteria)]|nr:hypothetical protein [Candidatus Stahlbacteria bacterium]